MSGLEAAEKRAPTGGLLIGAEVDIMRRANRVADPCCSLLPDANGRTTVRRCSGLLYALGGVWWGSLPAPLPCCPLRSGCSLFRKLQYWPSRSVDCRRHDAQRKLRYVGQTITYALGRPLPAAINIYVLDIISTPAGEEKAVRFTRLEPVHERSKGKVRVGCCFATPTKAARHGHSSPGALRTSTLRHLSLLTGTNACWPNRKVGERVSTLPYCTLY